MNTSAPTAPAVTPEQYRALQSPPLALPTPTELFEYQRARLHEAGLAQLGEFDRFADRLPASGLFLLVPEQPAPTNELDLNGLMQLIEVEGCIGRNYLDAKRLEDEIAVPDGPVLLVDVEDGAGRRNVSPKRFRRTQIQAEGRVPYTVWMGLIHVVLFPEVLKHHYLDLVGSRYGAGHVPLLYLRDGQPKLYASLEDYADPKWGAPSCGAIER